MVVPRPTMPTMGNYQGGSLTHSMLITAFSNFWPKDRQGHRNKVEFISPAKHLVGFELGTFQCLNPLHQYVYYNILSKLDPLMKPHWIFLKHILSQPQGIQGNRKFLKSKIDIYSKVSITPGYLSQNLCLCYLLFSLNHHHRQIL